jgi:hypothetical protein
MTSTRIEAANLIRPAMPKKWAYIDDERSLNVISRPTLIISQRNIAPSTIAPLALLTVTFAVIILSEHTDPTASENALDDLLITALKAIGTLPGLTWTNATKIVHLDRYMGYEITTIATLQLEN